MGSVRSIAKEAGVSITTVSRVLNNHPHVSAMARDAVLAVANRSRYVASVGRRSTTNVAVVYTGEISLGSPFDAGLIHGVSKGIEQSGHDLMILDLKRTCLPGETYTQMFMRKGVRGVIIRTTAQTRGLCEKIADEHFPAVVVGERFSVGNVYSIYNESRAPSRDAVEHLIGLGHRRIAVCRNVVDDSDHLDRVAGYQEALSDRGLDPDERLVLRVAANREGGIQVIKRILAMQDRPTAVYITDPMVCAGALAEAQRVGLAIPGDLSIIGFDDGDLRHCVFPKFSAVCQDAEALGRQASAMLDDLIAAGGPLAPRTRTFKCWLELHATTAPPPKTV